MKNMNHLLCCFVFLQYRACLLYRSNARKKRRLKHLQFLTGKVLRSPAVTSYPYTTIHFFSTLSSPPAAYELLTVWHFRLFSRISQTLLLCWQGHCHSGLKQGTTAWCKTPCPPPCGATSAARAVEPVPVSEQTQTLRTWLLACANATRRAADRLTSCKGLPEVMCFHPLLKAGSTSKSELCPVKSWLSPGREISQCLGIICSSASLLSQPF